MGKRLLTDTEISALLTEKKLLPANWHTRLRLRPKADVRFTQRELEVSGEKGHRFRIVLRQNTLNILDFSVILTFIDDDGSEFILLRFNGNQHEHTNQLEFRRKAKGKHKFRNEFHVHMATERYQIEGPRIDGYAEVTNDFSTFDSALTLFVRSNGFAVQPDVPGQGNLFAGI